jgi:hypothetical protein
VALVGPAVALNASWWFVVLGQLAYILMGYCPGAWNGFSRLAFRDLLGFARLSLGSAIMLWYNTEDYAVAGTITEYRSNTIFILVAAWSFGSTCS